MKTRKAHTVKAGDGIEGVMVFDTIRRGFDGYYIPMINGSQFKVRHPDTEVVVEE